MDGNRTDRALSRIDAALARLDAAASRLDDSRADLQVRNDTLRGAVTEALRRIDALIARQSRP
ncbi:MAG TPA: hypothetical protein VF440_07465 [Novosphingobium sp.]